MLEVRLPYDTKQRLMARCRDMGLSASEVVRDQIERFLAATARNAAEERTVKPIRLPESVLAFAARPQALALAAVAALGVAFFATPSRATPDLRGMFNHMDGNHDGTLTLDEFRTAMSDNDHIVVRREIQKQDAPPGTPPGERRERIVRGPIIIPAGPEAMRDRPPGPGERPSPEDVREMSGQEFGRMDMDGNAAVTFAEFESTHRAMMRASFVSLDDNQDGAVSAAEFDAGAPMAEGQGARIVADLDRDRNGSVSWAEFEEGPEHRPHHN